MKIVNCGCGKKYDKRMLNLDFNGNEDVRQCDITKGLPLKDDSVDWIYNSCFLEHLTPEQADEFLWECRRTLKIGGGIRIVVPDLEDICRAYLSQLEAVEQSDNDRTQSRYEYSVIELVDQFTRGFSGGEMLRYWRRKDKDADYLKKRHGNEIQEVADLPEGSTYTGIKRKVRDALKGVRDNTIAKTRAYQCYKAGEFALAGEQHKWMYDRYSVIKLLERNGYHDVSLKEFNDSAIPQWKDFRLEINEDGSEYKPHCIYVEGYK